MEKLIIKKEAYDEFLGHCLSNPNKEACGILAGRCAKIEKAFLLTNISEEPKFCYLIDPKEQLKVFKELRNQGLELIAIFHSHLDSQAYPSKKDIELAFYPESSYIIVSLSDIAHPLVRSFKIIEGEIKEDELVIENA